MFQHIVDKFKREDDYISHYYKDIDAVQIYNNVSLFFDSVREGKRNEIIRTVIIGGIDVNTRIRFVKEKRNIGDIFALGIAVANYDIDTINLLLDLGVDINVEVGIPVATGIKTNMYEETKKYCEELGIKLIPITGNYAEE